MEEYSCGKMRIGGVVVYVDAPPALPGRLVQCVLNGLVHASDHSVTNQQIVLRRECIDWDAMTQTQRDKFVRDVCIAALEHELDEWLRCGDRLVTVAHPKE